MKSFFVQRGGGCIQDTLSSRARPSARASKVILHTRGGGGGGGGLSRDDAGGGRQTIELFG